MKSFILIATVLMLSVIYVSSAPQFSGCGPDGCYNVNNNGQGVGCGPNGCGFIGQRSSQSSSNIQQTSARPGVACGPNGCGPVRNNGFGVGCGPNGCGPLSAWK